MEQEHIFRREDAKSCWDAAFAHGTLRIPAGYTAVDSFCLDFLDGDPEAGDSLSPPPEPVTVILPPGIRRIEADAFAGLTRLGEVELPESLTHIGDRAFAGCENLAFLFLPSSLTHIGAAAFRGCGFAEIDLPDGLETLGPGVCEGCGALLCAVLPKNLPRLPERAFAGCEKLEAVYWPNSLREIGDSAFFGCRLLHRAGVSVQRRTRTTTTGYISELVDDFPQELTTLGESAFAGCEELSRIWLLPPGLLHVGQEVFAESGLRRMKVPQSLKRLPKGFFRDCTQLEIVKLPQGLEEIEACVFEGCTALRVLEIPPSVSKIHPYSFLFCGSQLALHFAPGSPLAEYRPLCRTMAQIPKDLPPGRHLKILRRRLHQKNLRDSKKPENQPRGLDFELIEEGDESAFLEPDQ